MNDLPPTTTQRATTDEQKRTVVERLYVLWRAHPEVRLGQLLRNVSSDTYYREDIPLLETLEQFSTHISPP